MSENKYEFDEDGYIECGGCGGCGLLLNVHIEYDTYSIPYTCNICHGKGKIDWIEFIRKPPENYNVV